MSDEQVMMPCPFCGGTDLRTTWNDDYCKFVMCDTCECCGPTVRYLPEQYTVEVEAKKKWNMRMFTASIDATSGDPA